MNEFINGVNEVLNAIDLVAKRNAARALIGMLATKAPAYTPPDPDSMDSQELDIWASGLDEVPMLSSLFVEGPDNP